MRVLIVKTSSMGDVIHTLPALTDASQFIPGIQFDWVVEENFAEIPAWHPRVNQVIPMAWRRWRKSLFSRETRAEIKAFRHKIREQRYDLIIDAQGLVKSAIFSCFAKGKRCGLDFGSARESFASLFYHRHCKVLFEQHAVIRARSLFSQALGYELPQTIADYGIDRTRFANNAETPYLVFLHGTTWTTKHWPEENWMALAQIAGAAGFKIKLSWGNAAEQERALRIAAFCQQVEVLPRQSLIGMASVLAGAKAIVSVDTGLGHLAAALDVPTVSLYGPTDPALTGALGRSQVHMAATLPPCAPCFQKECTYQETSALKPACLASLLPASVWAALSTLF